MKVLVTCPPMLEQLDKFKDLFIKYDMEITAPNVIQTLKVDELIHLVPKHDGWIIGDDPASEVVFAAGKKGKLKAAVKWGIGVDNVDFNACKKLNIPITNTPGMFGNEVADLAMCYILGLARDAFLIDRSIRNGEWPKPSGLSLLDKKIGILGLGDIGLNIAKRACAHGFKVMGWDPNAKIIDDYINLKPFWPDGLSECDFLVFACALNAETRYSLDYDLLAKLKYGVKFVNISRGSLVCEAALIKGLEEGIISSAALDVFENEPLDKNHRIFNHPKCILGSHNGSNTIEGVRRVSEKAIELIVSMLDEE
jgi:D-3-phosphoglycerate dehydrogenase